MTSHNTKWVWQVMFWCRERCTVSATYRSGICLSANFKVLQYFWNGWSYAVQIWHMHWVTSLTLCQTFRHSKPRPVPQQTLSRATLSGTVNLALYPTVRHSKPCPVSHCHEQHSSPCAGLSGTANLALCPTVRHSKPCPVLHCEAQLASLVPCPTVRHSRAHSTPHC